MFCVWQSGLITKSKNSALTFVRDDLYEVSLNRTEKLRVCTICMRPYPCKNRTLYRKIALNRTFVDALLRASRGTPDGVLDPL